MKRILSMLLCCALALALLPAQALSLLDIHQQAPIHSTRLGIPIILPQSERAPVLRLTKSPVLPQLSEPVSASHAQAIPGAYGVAYHDPVWHNYGQADMRYNLPKGQEFAWKRISPPWDATQVYPENSALSLGEALAFVQRHAATAIGGDVQVDLFSFSVINSGIRGSASARGYEILPPYGAGAYELNLRQVIGGWMLMDSIQHHLADSYRGKHPEALARDSQARIASAESYFIGISALMIETVLADDITLCPIEEVSTAYERLRSAGQIGRLSELRLGYILFPDSAQAEKAIAFPCWLLKAEYLDQPYKNNDSFSDTSVEDSPHYAQLLVNAHTGQLLGPRITREQDAMAPAWGK